MEAPEGVTGSPPASPDGPKPRKPGTFVKGDPRRHKLPNMLTPEERAAAAAAAAPVAFEGDDALAAMRHVLVNARVHDKTPLQKLYRDVRKANPTKFAEEFKRLEAEARGAAGSAGAGGEPSSAPAPPPADLTADRLVELCREKLRRISAAVQPGGVP